MFHIIYTYLQNSCRTFCLSYSGSGSPGHVPAGALKRYHGTTRCIQHHALCPFERGRMAPYHLRAYAADAWGALAVAKPDHDDNDDDDHHGRRTRTARKCDVSVATSSHRCGDSRSATMPTAIYRWRRRRRLATKLRDALAHIL